MSVVPCAICHNVSCGCWTNAKPATTLTGTTSTAGWYTLPPPPAHLSDSDIDRIAERVMTKLADAQAQIARLTAERDEWKRKAEARWGCELNGGAK